MHEYVNTQRWNTHEGEHLLLPKIKAVLSVQTSLILGPHVWWKVVPLPLLVTQSCLTLFDPMDRGPPGSPVHRILQARILEWAAIPFSRGSSPSRDWTRVSCIHRQILYHLSQQESPPLSLVKTINREWEAQSRIWMVCMLNFGSDPKSSPLQEWPGLF